MLVLLALLNPVHAGDCASGPTTPAQMEAHVDDALFAFATLDEQGVYDAADQAGLALDCVSKVLTEANAAAYHRLVGIRSFMAGDADAALTAFQAARAIQPGYMLSGKIAPEGGRLYRLYQQAGEPPGGDELGFRAPKRTEAWVNGEKGTYVSSALPSVVQYTDDDGQVVWTAYLEPNTRPPYDIDAKAVADAGDDAADDEMPDSAEDLLGTGDLDLPEDVDEPDEPDELEVSDDLADLAAALDEEDAIPTDVDLDDQRRKAKEPKERKPKKAKEGGGGNGLVWTGVAVAGAGLAMMGGAALTRSSFDNEPTATKFHLTNGLYYGSLAGIGVGAGLVVTGAIVSVEF